MLLGFVDKGRFRRFRSPFPVLPNSNSVIITGRTRTSSERRSRDAKNMPSDSRNGALARNDGGFVGTITARTPKAKSRRHPTANQYRTARHRPGTSFHYQKIARRGYTTKTRS